MANQDFSALLSAAPDAAPAVPAASAAAAPAATPVATTSAAPSPQDFSALLSAAPDAPASVNGDGLFDSLIYQESRGRQFDAKGAPLTSKKGATGVAQVMPGTAKEAAQLAGVPYDDMRYRTDPEYNKTLGRAYFNKQMEDFQDPAKALAAYNAGPGAVRNAMVLAQRDGNPDGWLNHLPAETRAYVPAILNRSSKTAAISKPAQDSHSNTYTPPVQQTSFVDDIWRGVKHGAAVTVPKAVGDAAKFFGAEDAGNALTQFAASNDTSDKQESDYGKSLDSPLSVRGNVYEAADNSMLSIGPGAAGAAVGAGVGAFFGGIGAGPGALIGYGLGSLASLPIFYGSQGQQTYEKVKKAQLDAGVSPQAAEQNAREAGHLSGGIEAGGEMVSDVIPFAKLFKPFAKPTAKATGTVVKNMFFPTVKQAGKGILTTEAGEISTEMMQQAGEDAVEGAYGAGPGATWHETSKVIMPTALMALVPGLAGAASKHAQVNATRRALESKDTPPDVRANMAAAAAHEMAGVSEDTARNFALYAGKQIKDGAPIEISDDAFYAAQAAQISPETRVDPALQPVAKAAAEGGTLSKAAMAGVTATEQLQQPTVQPDPDPTARLNELRAKVTGGQNLTAQELTEYDDLNDIADRNARLRTPEDPIAKRVAEIEDQVRQGGVLQTLRSIGQQGVTEKEFLEALAIARNPELDKKSPLIRQRALESLESAMSWAQQGKMPGLTQERGLAPIPGVADLSGSAPGNRLENNGRTIDVDATRVDNMLPGPRALPKPDLYISHAEQPASAARPAPQPAAQEEAPQQQAPIASPTIQQTVDQATEGLPRAEIPPMAPGETPNATNTAARRKRAAQIAQLAGIGFETVERRGSDFFLINAKTGQEVKLDGMADAQMARAAIAKTVNDRAHTAAASPNNDRLEPTPAQIKAGNYKKSDVIDLNGMKIVIENPAGSMRRGVAPDGKAWESKMNHHYGEFLGTEGADGDRLDVFIGNRPDSNKVFVIDQVNPDGSFDESKVVMGVTSEDQARETYLSNYEKGWTGLGAMTEMSLDEFKAWAKSDRAKQPLMLGKQDKVFTVTDRGTPVQLMALDTSEVGDASAPRAGKGKFISKKDADLVTAVASVFGVKVQFFRPVTPGFSADGFFNGGNTLYLNERTTISPLAVFGHEFMHRIRASNPKAYDSIAKVVAENVKDPNGYREDYFGKEYAEQHGDAPLTNAELEELVSDLHGNLMTDSKFWGDVFRQISADHGKEAKGIIAQLSAFLGKTIDALVNSLKGKNFNAGQFVNNMKDVRAAFRDGLAQHLNESGVTKTAMQAEILRAEQKTKGTDIKRSTPKPNDGLTVDGYHFSQAPREILSTDKFGTGLKGSGRDEILASSDPRIKQRLSFYVDKGTGIHPEAGVGGYAHKAELTNLYDADADKLRLKTGDARAFESKVLDAGYSGYLTRLDGTQSGHAILLGAQTIKPEVLGQRTTIEGAKTVPAAAEREMDLGDKIMANKALPGGSLSPSRWVEILTRMMPAEAAQLLDVGALGADPLYKDELVAKIRKLQPEIKRSAQRAKDEYAEVEAKYRGTDSWMKAPNGQPTNLTERQWVQVRTPSFQKWFGPWEKYAAEGKTVWHDGSGEVSKVVDENGEPLVVLHGTGKGGFMEFKQPGGDKRGDLGIFTTSDLGMAESYVRRNRARRVVEPEQGIEPQAGDQPGVYALFVNIRNPHESDFEGANWDGTRQGQFIIVDEDGEQLYAPDGTGYFDDDALDKELARLDAENISAKAEDAPEHYESTDSVVREARKYKNDGAFIRQVRDDGGGTGYSGDPADVFVALDPSQLKSADFNNGEFNDSTGDIRKSTAKPAKRPAQDPAIGDKTDVSKLPVGRVVPQSAAVGGLESSLELARSKSYRRGRELKKDIQDRVLAAAKAAKVRLDERTKSTFEFLSGMVVADAKFALKSNENAVGWYDQKVSRAIGALSTVHPEINSDPRSRLAFLWALATTSNGLKVNKNFELAERAYRQWKANGVMPTNIGVGNAAQAINKGLAAYNTLVAKVGDERMLKFMSTPFEVGQIQRMLGMKVGGEWMGTPVRGSAILGPKIGNGFFSNLNGYFDALTMDRWLMRTWGRMTGTLLEVTPKDIDKSRRKLTAKISAMSDSERKSMSSLIGRPIKKNLTRAEVDAIAKASQKASMKTDKREVMMAADATNEFRKAANLHHMTMDGQKEAPSGPAERNWIRAVFQKSLDELRAEDLDMTMSDLQALLWYPERRLYDAAKSEEDVANGYEDDEAPDYANAAHDLAVSNGVDRVRVLAAMDAAEARGTVQGKQLSDAEKQAMLDEFKSPPEQPMQLVYEVAPNPDNVELTQAWEKLPLKDRKDVTELVRDAILADVTGAFGIKLGKSVSALGGFEGHVNPNIISEYKTKSVSYADARALAAALGIALDQKSVVIADPRAESVNSMVRITLPKKAGPLVDDIMKAVGDATGAYDFTSRGNNIDILNFTDLSTETFADKIEQAVGDFDEELEFHIAYGEVKSELIEGDKYESEIEAVRPGSGREILERAWRARDRAREIIEAELRARGAVEVPGLAGSARRADASSGSEASQQVGQEAPPSKAATADQPAAATSLESPAEPQRFADDIAPEQARGRQVIQEVEIEDTGKTGKLSVDAERTLADYNQRIESMKKLLGCLRK